MDTAEDQRDPQEAPKQDDEPQQSAPDVSFVDDGGRPKVKKYSIEPRFRPNDYVFVQVSRSQREGPYIVAYVKDGRYTLCDSKGRLISNGATFSEKDLELQDPFA